MVIIKGNIRELKPLKEPVALTLGNFDGVHRGHVHLLGILREKAHHRGLKTALLTFAPHPCSLLENPHFKPLQTETMKMKHLKKQGVDYVVVQDFDRVFSDVSKENFLDQYLMFFFELRFLLFGYDFSFGRKGEGDFDFARHFFKTRSVEIYKSGTFGEGDDIVSSSKIRDLLAGGEIEKANQKLGYSFSLEGKVVKGKALGKELGFPTANLEEIPCLIPGQGVYAGWVDLFDEKKLAVMNIGQCPSIQDQGKISVECHIPDFHGHLYNQKLCFCFAGKLRDEKKFLNWDDLKNQIRQDVNQARRIVNPHFS